MTRITKLAAMWTLAAAGLWARHPETGGAACTSCHSDLMGSRVEHAAAAADCTSCHDVPEKGGEATLTAPPAELCGMCHETFEGKHMHGPVAVGACVACHDPHSSDHDHLVRIEGNQLCFICHQEMQERLEAEPFRHQALESGCTTCHDPHASEQTAQLKSPVAELCGQCHGDILETARSAKVKHPPVTEPPACLNCHRPHAAEHRPLLKADGLAVCLSCHDGSRVKGLTNMKKLLADNPDHHGPIRERDCSGCHQPHGSNFFRLLFAEYPATFYAPYREENFALCFSCHDSALATEAETTTVTDFRNGARNLHYVHVHKARKGRTCRACHETHASRHPNHIRDSVPFGNWQLPINYKETSNGGSCAPGCHRPESYTRAEADASH